MSWIKLQRLYKTWATTKWDGDYAKIPKDEFRKVGRTALNEIAGALKATGFVSNCKVDYNPGGIAVSGDFHLRGDFNEGGSFDLFFNIDRIGGDSLQICYRKTKNQKDYTGGRNHWTKFSNSAEDIVELILQLRKEDLDVNKGANFLDSSHIRA